MKSGVEGFEASSKDAEGCGEAAGDVVATAP